MTFAELIRMWLAVGDMPRKDAAKTLGISVDTINSYASGRSEPPGNRAQFILKIVNDDIEEAYQLWSKNWMKHQN